MRRNKGRPAIAHRTRSSPSSVLAGAARWRSPSSWCSYPRPWATPPSFGPSALEKRQKRTTTCACRAARPNSLGCSSQRVASTTSIPSSPSTLRRNPWCNELLRDATLSLFQANLAHILHCRTGCSSQDLPPRAESVFYREDSGRCQSLQEKQALAAKCLSQRDVPYLFRKARDASAGPSSPITTISWV